MSERMSQRSIERIQSEPKKALESFDNEGSNTECGSERTCRVGFSK